MILSVSRRTDIPAFYADWFFARLRAGEVMARNPMRHHSVGRIALSPDTVDGIVFWTKNPAPMLDRLPLLAPYPYYFHITITAYGEDIEPHVPSKDDVILPAVRRLSDAIGPRRVIWRFDPILRSEAYPLARQLARFDALARALSPYVGRCVISFVDTYKNTRRNAEALALLPLTEADMLAAGRALADIAGGYGLPVSACCEPLDLRPVGITPSRCIDAALLEELAGRPLGLSPDRGQRPGCGCAASVDIGAYNTCPGGCRYCYANYDARRIPENIARHEADSPLLVGRVEAEDQVYWRGGR